MKFDLEKYATAAINWGKIMNRNRIKILNGQTIKSHQDKAYKYLGTLQLDNIKHEQVKNAISEEYIQRVRKVLKAKLNGGNFPIKWWKLSYSVP